MIGCSTDKIINENPAICTALDKPISTHVDSLIDNGEAIIGVGADEVLVTGDILVSAYDGACQ